MSNLDNNTHNALDISSNEEKQNVVNNLVNEPADVHTNKIEGKLELLEERAVVDKERLDVGRVIATKKLRRKVINVPVELVEEVLVIETEYFDTDSKEVLTGLQTDEDGIRHIDPVLNNGTSITVNGQKVTLGDEPVEVVLSRQVATVSKETYVVQEVSIEKTQHIHKEVIDVELRREELDVIEEGFLDHQDVNR